MRLEMYRTLPRLTLRYSGPTEDGNFKIVGNVTSTNIALSYDSESLRDKLQAVDITVPLRTEGRKTAHTERWVICRLLSTLASCGQLAFPVSVAHRDKPDFLLAQGSRQVGVEATEAISEQYAAFSALAEREFPDVLLDPGHFRWGSPQKSVEEMRDILRHGQLTAPPWAGDRPEEEWALSMESIVRVKLGKLARPDFAKFEENWLAIYHNLPIPNVHLQTASHRLLPKIADVWKGTPAFTRIYIEHGPVILEIQEHGTAHFVLDDLW